PFAVPSHRVILAAIGGAFRTGAVVFVLLRLDPNTLAAVATAALAAFAGVQVAREILSSQRRRAAIARRLTGAAWLARRSCEVLYGTALATAVPTNWRWGSQSEGRWIASRGISERCSGCRVLSAETRR